MNVPSALGGRLNATVPLAVLTIGEDTLRMHPRWFAGAMFSDFEVPLNEISAAFLLSGTFMTSGVGFQISDGQLAYFWMLGEKSRILAVLQQRGVLIDPVPRRANWRIVGPIWVVVETGSIDFFGGQGAGVFAIDEGADAILHGRRNRRHRDLRLDGNALWVVRSCHWGYRLRPVNCLLATESQHITQDTNEAIAMATKAAVTRRRADDKHT